jgi:hypothetical protein
MKCYSRRSQTATEVARLQGEIRQLAEEQRNTTLNELRTRFGRGVNIQTSSRALQLTFKKPSMRPSRIGPVPRKVARFRNPR